MYLLLALSIFIKQHCETFAKRPLFTRQESQEGKGKDAPALFANAHLLLNKLRFAAELKNKNIRFLHAISSYAKLSLYQPLSLASKNTAQQRGCLPSPSHPGTIFHAIISQHCSKLIAAS